MAVVKSRNLRWSVPRLYGASRFCAFVVAAKTGDRDNYNAERDAAIDYYTNEFKAMLEENLNDYSRVFDNEK